ncbi:MAG TPA: transporter associated domain-containing protein [Saprospiraceae bacterium]|nr:transporter associated domain-containing protein [Saprospiraceae bacterium]
MGWIVLLFFSYLLCLMVERSLIGLSTYDLDVLRTENSRAARQALALSAGLRATLASLLLARILLIIGSGLWFVVAIWFNPEWRTGIEGLAERFAVNVFWWWTGVLFLFFAVFALFFWGIYRLTIKAPVSAATWLKRLWWVPAFWRTLFKPFLLQEENVAPAESGAQTQAQQTASGSEKRELELLKSIVQFGEVTVKQVMQPRSKVVSVDFRTDFHELLRLVRQSEFSRLPVQDEDLDNVTGILYVKDLLPYLDEPAEFEWQALIRTNVLMVPESKRGSELLEDFKEQKMHMAIVVDEYGGIAGICTLEDILEEVIGDIRDEFDEESEIRYRKLDDYNYLFEGQTMLNDVCRLSGLAQGAFDEARGASDTLAGLVLELRGDIPHAGAEVSWNDFRLKVTKANKRRVEQVLLTLPKSGTTLAD